MNERMKMLVGKLHVEEQEYGGNLAYAMVTPEMAKELLELSAGNRPLSKKSVAKYRRHIEAGTWVEEPISFIKFDENGALIDGHHRLTALKQSGKTVKMYFLFNVKKNPYIDCGRSRSEADRFAMMEGRTGVGSYRRAIAICNVFSQLKMEDLRTEADRFEFIKKEEKLFVWIADNLSPKGRGLGNAPITAAMFTALKQGIPFAKVEHFWSVLQTGYAAGEDDRRIIRLRDSLRDKYGESRRLEYRSAVYTATLDCINGYTS